MCRGHFGDHRRTLRRNASSETGTGTGTGQLYHGPLAKTYRNLKIFSLTSLGLAASMTPFFFIVESTLPLSARVGLAGVVMGTGGISTALVGWCGSPYVSALRKVGDGDLEAVEMETTTLLLKRRFTTVYDWKWFLRESGRPFAKWELANDVEGSKKAKEEVREETVAETRDDEGRVLGRWIVTWKDGRGVCRGEGKIVRYFNVHEELL